MGDIFDVNDKVVKSDDKHMTPPMQRSISPYDENYDSDWDSWEDEEEACISSLPPLLLPMNLHGFDCKAV